MSDFKCTFCPHTYANCNGLSKHMNICVLTAGKNEQLFVNNPAQVCNYLKPIKQNQNKNFNINEYKSDSEFFTKKLSFKDIKFCKTSKVVKDIQFNSNSNLDSTFASPLHASNTDELASSLDNMSFELDNSNINSNMFEVDPTSNLFDDLETTIDEDQEFSNKILNNSTYFEHIQSSSSDVEIDQKYEEFPNEAYADLMVLVTKYKLSNVAGNAIILFFNIIQNIQHHHYQKIVDKEKGSKVLSIILYSDTTNCDTLEQTFHRCLEVILNSIQKFSHSGTNLLINNKFVWTFPKVLIIITNWPKAATFCLTYKSTNSNYPCHFCLVNRDDLANTTHSKHDLVLRNYKNMQNCLNKNEEKSVCIKSIPNYFWNFNDMNIYEATVIDRMHHLDLGLFKYQINFKCNLIKEKYGASILDTINNRLANISRFLELKNFKNGIQSLARITANEYRNLMKVMIFVLDNLNINESIQNKLLKLHEDWNNMYLLS
ncbi:hypothetical protein F8M41_006343 [Gigaspora margarita]|uniref:Uncharacterized protein n=1 Tax=Gigaspora margarita TaxID=4874 RepID=A0A8H3X6M8_GIGMA|nr:hypothetical protein F8M41_006343 [Gigaspora margarita]